MGYFKREAQLMLLLAGFPVVILIVLSLLIRDPAKVVVAFLVTLTLAASAILYRILRHK
jgi:maltodextrin utilization protein YvdJ